MRKTQDRRKPPRGRDPLAGLLTPVEVAARKEVTPPSVIRAIREGRLRAWEKNGMLFVPEKELSTWQPVRGRGKKPQEK